MPKPSPVREALRGIRRDAAAASMAPTEEEVSPELLIRIGFELPGTGGLEVEMEDEEEQPYPPFGG